VFVLSYSPLAGPLSSASSMEYYFGIPRLGPFWQV